MTAQQQLELSLAESRRANLAAPTELRQQQARWWFSQMRQVVEHALEWEPAPRFASQPAAFAPTQSLRRR